MFNNIDFNNFYNNNEFAKDVMQEVIAYNELTADDVREFTYTNEMTAFFASDEGKNRTQTGLEFSIVQIDQKVLHFQISQWGELLLNIQFCLIIQEMLQMYYKMYKIRSIMRLVCRI